MQFPQEINTHIASFIADEVRGADPQCYRSARSMQAAWRGWLTRTHIMRHVYDFYHNPVRTMRRKRVHTYSLCSRRRSCLDMRRMQRRSLRPTQR